MTPTFSAPGKLYLLGEYAVLHGAAALIMAVDRRATVTVSPSTANWSLSAPELGIEALDLGPHAELPKGLEAGAALSLALFDAVRSGARERGSEGEPQHIIIRTSDFLNDGYKLGLGSSAAVSVALTAALAASKGAPLTREAIFALATSAHARAQGGRGSGGDVAASVYGGLLLFRREHPPEPMNWPDGLDLFAVVTGTGSSTVDLVSRVADYAARHPKEHDRDIEQLASLAATIPVSLKNADEFLALADQYFLAIEALDAHADAGIVTDRHRELRAIAAASGAVFKTSGAGGGDVGLVFAKLEATDQLRSVFIEAGATVIPVPYSQDGVRTEDS